MAFYSAIRSKRWKRVMAREARKMEVVVVVTEGMVRAAIIAQDLKKLTIWAAHAQGVRLTSGL
jgi:hypothetical protein